MKVTLTTLILYITIATLLPGGMIPFAAASGGHDHGGHDGHGDHEEEVKGPHGGRLLGTEEFQAEVTIYEPGIPPQSRVYFYSHGKQLDPEKVEFSMELHRIDRTDTLKYKKQSDYLIGDKIVEEPHSFDVHAHAIFDGKTYEWEYSSHEGRTEISPEAVASSGIVTELAGPTKIRTTVQLSGNIIPDEDRLLHVTPRFSGVVKSLEKQLGDRVKKGDVLALMESNESLNNYKVRSAIDGVVIRRNPSLGEVLDAGESMYVIADLSTVWVDLNVYRKDISKLQVGQTVILNEAANDSAEIKGKLTYISPVGDPDTQMFLARAVVDNSNMALRPGIYISGNVILEEETVPVAIKTSALQKFRDWDVVFKQKGNLFEIAIVELGRRDGEWVEVLSGLTPNTRYVTENSFVLKADILKSSAGHNH